MGVCQSCLGLNRHPSQEDRETDPLLDEQQGQYGAISSGDSAQPGEEELRREREELEHITSEATDNMIDVLHPGTSNVSHRDGSVMPSTATEDSLEEEEDDEDDEAAAWLRSVQAAGVGDVTAVQGLQSGDLVMDITQLREEPTPLAAKRSSKARLPS